MNLLYLSEDYINSSVHHQLLNSIVSQESQISATVLAIKRKGIQCKEIDSLFQNIDYKVITENFKGSSFLYKYVFPYKIAAKKAIAERCCSVSEYDFIHAATLFSEGGLAYELHKHYGIPYSIAVRGSDINFYLQKMPHLWKYGQKIAENAEHIVFISENIREKFYKTIAFRKKEIDLMKKSIVISNGIDSYWIKNRVVVPEIKNGLSILYVGRLDKNKNLGRLIEACHNLRTRYPEITLSIVGEGGDNEVAITEQAAAMGSWIKICGGIYDKSRLREEFRKHSIFAMVSHSETFGLVYIEALTQGLPIIYSKGEGISGSYSEGLVGFGVDSWDVLSIMKGIEMAIIQWKTLSNNVLNIDLNQYDWEKIGKHYIEEVFVNVGSNCSV